MIWLRAVPVWCWWMIALVMVFSVQQHRIQEQRDATTAARDEFRAYRVEISERNRLAMAQARTEEQRRAAAQQEARVKGHEERTIADAGATDADAAGQRLRSDAAQLAASVSCPGTDTAAIARGKAATRAAMVLSDLLTRADARAGELAKAYDQARIAGEQCEREYDGPRPSG
ncbi:DUF2514 domain-containing protein [Pseudomonas sp. SWRI100]|nr:DUF2514 domain-containing protein [Pseudomonas sp. SWRI67]MBV4525435.1 DUF2514 domain-containing protein [Pseudomonas kermanshahensis]